MADENNNRENEGEPPRTQSARKLPSNLGRLHDGEWFCDCIDFDCKAVYLKAGQDTGHPNQFFWRCPKSRDRECKFFLWAEDEGARKDRLARLGLLSAPTTPTRKNTNGDSLQTPFSRMAKRNRDAAVIDDEDDLTIVGDDAENIYTATPTRKAPKTTSASGPHQGLPTPDTGRAQGTASGLPIIGTPPLFNLQREYSSNNEKASLTATILKLLAAENIQLKESTVGEIGEAIGMELGRYKATIHQLESR